MIRAMQAELDREKAQLLLPGMQKPYFMEYRLDDLASYEAVANYGALTREEERASDGSSGSRCASAITRWIAAAAVVTAAVQLAPTDDNPRSHPVCTVDRN